MVSATYRVRAKFLLAPGVSVIDYETQGTDITPAIDWLKGRCRTFRKEPAEFVIERIEPDGSISCVMTDEQLSGFLDGVDLKVETPKGPPPCTYKAAAPWHEGFSHEVADVRMPPVFYLKEKEEDMK